ncbi:MAG: hypothetical protein AAFO62_05525, partial [Pseudomonadota bacterium]
MSTSVTEIAAKDLETGERAVVQLSVDQLIGLAKDPETDVVLLADGRLALKTENGLVLPLNGTAAIAEAFDSKVTDLLDVLQASPELRGGLAKVAKGALGTSALLPEITSDIAGLTEPGAIRADDRDDSASAVPEGGDDSDDSNDDANIGGTFTDARAVSVGDISRGDALGGSGLDGGFQADASPREDIALGKTDLPHGEAGSAGELLQVGVGTPIKHLVGLIDEEPGLRNGESIRETRSAHVPGLSPGADNPHFLDQRETTFMLLRAILV